MKITVTKEKKLEQDGIVINLNNINTNFLEMIVEQGLKDDVEWDIYPDEDDALCKLFNDIEEMCKKDSDFRMQIEQIRSNENIKPKNESDDNQTIENEGQLQDDLPF